MISFMVIAAPRSGTTWAANWLTTSDTLCFHGLSAKVHYSEWDALPGGRVLGVSDTGICLFPTWLNSHPARKLILHRDPEEIAVSLGATHAIPEAHWGLDKIRGVHAHWQDIFDPVAAKKLYEFLTLCDFDEQRHALLCEYQINTMLRKVKVNQAVAQKLVAELRESIHV